MEPSSLLKDTVFRCTASTRVVIPNVEVRSEGHNLTVFLLKSFRKVNIIKAMFTIQTNKVLYEDFDLKSSISSWEIYATEVRF